MPGASQGVQGGDAVGRAATARARQELVACPVCGRDEPRSYPATPYRLDGMSFPLVRCPCGMVYVNPRPDGESIGRMYADPSYYEHGYTLGVEEEGYFERQGELIAQYERTARGLAAEIGGSGDLLELGSAGGFFLEGARRAGFRVKGTELSPRAVEYSRRELGLDVYQGPLEEAPFPAESFDVAYADNVLEHTTAPEEVLATLRRLIKPGGHLVVIVPSYINSVYFRLLAAARAILPRRFLGGPLLRILKMEPAAGGERPYHLLEFDRRTLVRLIRRAGFEVVRVERSLPQPAHLFRAERPALRVRLLRGVFSGMDALMRAGLLPGARLSVLARRGRSDSKGTQAPSSPSPAPRPASRPGN